MKTLVKTFAFLALVIAGTWLFPQRVSAQNENVSLQVFYDELSPYGTWIEDPTYGYVWAPNVDADFSPYVTNGHWVYTDYGWTWVSDFSWGWAPFHYGRWIIDPTYGNVWVPDTEWGPAWVTWRQANGYYGWTPMGPGINISIAFGNSYNVPRDRWVFVRDRDFMQNNLNRYRIDRSLNYRIYDNSIVIRNSRSDINRHSNYVLGPRREDVQRFSGRVISPVRIRDNDRPGQSYNSQFLSIYRPQIQRKDVNGRVAAPRNINRDRNVQSVQQHNVNASGNSRVQQPSRNVTPTNTGRYTQPVQQPNANPSRYQKVEQPSKNVNTQNTARFTQPVQRPSVNVQRPSVNPSNNQRAAQPAHNVNTQNTARYSQPGQRPTVNVQRPTVNPSNNQRAEQPSRNVSPQNTARNTQPVQQPAANQPRPQSQNAPSQSAKPPVNIRAQQAKMVVNPEKDKKVESKDNSNGPRR